MIFKQAVIILTFIYCFWQNTPTNLPKDHVLGKYYENWNKIKKTLNIKFYSMPVYDEKYIKAKVRKRHSTASAENVISNALNLT